MAKIRGLAEHFNFALEMRLTEVNGIFSGGRGAWFQTAVAGIGDFKAQQAVVGFFE